MRMLLCAIFVLFAATTVSAQFNAAIQGTVTDAKEVSSPARPSRSPAKRPSRSQQTTDSDEGFYRFSGLAARQLHLERRARRLQKARVRQRRRQRRRHAGHRHHPDAGRADRDRHGHGRRGAVLETENANINKSITTEEVRQLPQFGRDPYELLRLTPGVFGEGARSGTRRVGRTCRISRPRRLQPQHLPDREPAPDLRQRPARLRQQFPDRRRERQQPGLGRRGGRHAESGVGQRGARRGQRLLGRVRAQLRRADADRLAERHERVPRQRLLQVQRPGLNAFNKYGGPNAPPVRVNKHFNQFGGQSAARSPAALRRRRPRPCRTRPRFFFFSYEGLRSNTNETVTAFVETPEFRQRSSPRGPAASRRGSSATRASRRASSASSPSPAASPASARTVNKSRAARHRLAHRSDRTVHLLRQLAGRRA